MNAAASAVLVAAEAWCASDIARVWALPQGACELRSTHHVPTASYPMPRRSGVTNYWALAEDRLAEPVAGRGAIAACMVALAGMTATGCTESPLEPIDIHPQYASAGPVMGQIPIPQNTFHWGGAVPWQEAGISIAPYTWLKVQVTGAVIVDANPLYKQAFPGLPTPLAGATIGPPGDAGRFEVQVRLRTPSGWASSPFPLKYAGDSSSGFFFLYFPMAAVVDVRRTGAGESGASCAFSRPPGYTAPGPCWGGSDHFEAATYLLSGKQVITTAQVAPVTLAAEPTRIAPSDTVTFTASSQGGLGSLQWHWVPNDTGAVANAPFHLTRDCADGVNPCRYAPASAGRMYVRAFSQAANDVQVASSPVIRFCASEYIAGDLPATIKPSIARLGSQTAMLKFSLKGCQGTGSLAGREINVFVDGVEGSGGHLGHTGAMPAGGVASTVLITNANGSASTPYTSGEYSGVARIRAESPDTDPFEGLITIEIPNLVQVVESMTIDTTGVLQFHPSNHWAIPAMAARLNALADSMWAITGYPLRLNDISLESGGKFDVRDSPERHLPPDYTQPDHAEHMNGEEADVGNMYGGQNYSEIIKRLWESMGSKRPIRPYNDHRHLRYR